MVCVFVRPLVGFVVCFVSVGVASHRLVLSFRLDSIFSREAFSGLTFALVCFPFVITSIAVGRSSRFSGLHRVVNNASLAIVGIVSRRK